MLLISLLLLLQKITCYNHFSLFFCLLSVFLVRCFFDRGFFWRHLMLCILFSLMASSCPGFPYSLFSFNALLSLLLPNHLQCASWFCHLASFICPKIFLLRKSSLEAILLEGFRKRMPFMSRGFRKRMPFVSQGFRKRVPICESSLSLPLARKAGRLPELATGEPPTCTQPLNTTDP